jgi:hypothetical protein
LRGFKNWQDGRRKPVVWVSSQSRNRALSYVVAAREFGERGTFRPPLAGLGLLRRLRSKVACAALARGAPAGAKAGPKLTFRSDYPTGPVSAVIGCLRMG